MPIKQLRETIDIEISDLDDHTFSLRGLEHGSEKAMMPFTIASYLFAGEFKAPMAFTLPKEWYFHHTFLHSVQLHREKDQLKFVIQGARGGNAVYPVEARELFDMLGITEWDEYYGNLKEIEGLPGIYSALTINTDNAFITDSKTFFMLVDRYDNNEVLYVYHVSEYAVLHDACVGYDSAFKKELQKLPEGLMSALADNPIAAAWDRERKAAC